MNWADSLFVSVQGFHKVQHDARVSLKNQLVISMRYHLLFIMQESEPKNSMATKSRSNIAENACSERFSFH